jgi:hypothetical protein
MLMIRTRQLRAVAVALAAVGMMGSTAMQGAASPAAAPQPSPARAFRTPLYLYNLYCLSTGNGTAWCYAEARGGTGGYTYTWDPQLYAGSSETGGSGFIYCTPYRDNDVVLTARDSSGATLTAYSTVYCGDAV